MLKLKKRILFYDVIIHNASNCFTNIDNATGVKLKCQVFEDKDFWTTWVFRSHEFISTHHLCETRNNKFLLICCRGFCFWSVRSSSSHERRNGCCSICSDTFTELSVVPMASESAESRFTGHRSTISEERWRLLPSNPSAWTRHLSMKTDVLASCKPESPLVSPDRWAFGYWTFGNISESDCGTCLTRFRNQAVP